jgi:hypothetical protein
MKEIFNIFKCVADKFVLFWQELWQEILAILEDLKDNFRG